MEVGHLLSKLSKVKRSGQGRWVALCPAHEDRSPSLAVRATDQGIILLKCFAGCSVHEVTSSIGIEMSDLFPDRQGDHRGKGERRAFGAEQALTCLDHEAAVIYLFATDMLKGRRLTEAEKQRLGLAAQRVAAARETVLPRGLHG